MGKMIKKDDVFLMRLNTAELFLVSSAAQADEVMFKKDGRPDLAEVARSVLRKIAEGVDRKTWLDTVYTEVPIHG